MYELEKVHFVLDEMVMNGYIVETNKSNILKIIDLVDRESKKDEGLFRWKWIAMDNDGFHIYV